MANTIKIKRSAVSGKVPTTAQLELGELAVNTHDGKLYTKKDDGTAAVVQIGDAASTADALSTARTIALGGDVSGSTSFDGSANVTITATVADDSHNHVISNVDGLQTALDAKLPLSGGQLTGNITFSGAQTVDGRDSSADGSKLDGIESGATADQTASEILTAIKTVDGAGSGLDADTLDGVQGASYAQLASPTFTGTPAAPTAAAGTNTTQIATTAFVSTAVANVIDSAPGALDTLNELAAALGDDANFSTTVTNSIATKLPLSGGQMTGNITFSGSQTVDGRDLSVDGAKLDGIAAGAQVNVATNLAQGTRTTTTVPVTSSTGTDATLTAATTSLAGVMTSADKSKLDGIAAGAQVNVATNLGVTTTTTSNTITSSTGTNATIGEATSSAAGLMSTTHHDKLDGIAAGATNVTNNNQLTNGAGYITSSGSISGNAATATQLQTARTIGGVSFNGTANINLPGVNTTGNQNTSGSSASCTGNAATATTLQTARTINGVSFNGSGNITVEAYVENDDSTNATRYLTFVDNSTASFKRLNEDSSLTYNPSSNVLSAGTFSGALSGNASTATTLQTARTINGTSFNGSANITITANTPNTLSRGSYLTGSNFNGGSATTWAVDATTSSTASKIVARDGSGHIYGNYIFGVYLNMSHSQATRNSDTIFYSSTDAYLRKNTASGMRSSLSVPGLTTNNTFTLAQRGQVDAISSSSSITPNFANSNNFSISLSTNTTINNPSNLVAGQSGAIAITYNGGYTVAFGSYWKFPGGTAPTATSTSGKTDVLVYYVESSTRISAQLILNTGG